VIESAAAVVSRAPGSARERSASEEGRALEPTRRDSPGAWVAASLAGSEAAFEELYRRFAPAVHGILLARLRPAEAEDLVQEVFLEAWRRLAQLREAEAFGGWICTIARRKAVDWRRAERATEPLPAELPSAATAGVTLEAQRALEAIRSLPEAYREPLVLRLVGGLSSREIAGVTGLTEGSVRVNLHRGLRQLRERMGVGHAKR
jgi:RNA polymerase sigma-70 factor (ECF subfamily)